MRRTVLRVVSILVLGTSVLLLVGCGDGQEVAPTGEPVSLPPTRSAATPTAEPSPTATLPPPTPTPTAEPSPTPQPTAAPSPTPEATVVEPSPTPGEAEEPVTLTTIGELNGLLGQEVTVEGTVVGAESFSSGFKFTIDDGTGQVTLLMWQSVYDNCWDASGINLGARLRATGEVGEYQGELQVVPSWGGAVKTLEPAAAWGEPRDIGSLTGADEGQRVMIEGEVVRVEGLASAVKVSLSDGSGEVVVFIWRNVLDRIPDNAGLGTEGSRVRVVGTVQVYHSNLEVVPTLPYDVEVLEVP